MTLAIFHPTLQLSAVNTLSTQKTSEKKIQNGKLKNGLSFSIVPSSQLKDGLWIRVGCTIPPQENKSLAMLHQHAAFYGTEELSRENISESLNQLGLDIDGDSFIQMNENGICLQFSLSHSTHENVQQLLQIIEQVMLHPTLQNDEVEVARLHLLDALKDEPTDTLSLKSTTASEIRNFHDTWFLSKNINLSIAGLYHSSEMIQVMTQVFESPIETLEEIPLTEVYHENSENAEEDILTNFADRIDLATDNQTWVIDGKIWMSEPDWINKSSNGRTLGTFLTVLGICGMILAFPVAAPIAIIAGGTTTVTGVYFLSSHYFKDPTYIETIRQTNLKQGFTYAYQKQQAGMTFTPFERRASLIQEMIQKPHSLPKLPILVLADIYQLHDPVIAEIFTQEEFTIISDIKRNFIQQRNQYKLLKNALEQELASQVAPYTLVRDTALLYAQNVYNQNSYVVAKKELDAEKDASIAEIEKAYKKSIIPPKEREAMLSETENDYQACMADPQFKAGLDAAKSDLDLAQMAIEATYAFQVELCKQSIQYYARMENLKLGEKSVIDYFNIEFISQLSYFPIYLNTLPDYLDLRFL